MSTPIATAVDARPPSTAFYRAVWRWHFYAGLLCLPFLLLLAVTGGLYLFKDEINGLIYANLLYVDAPVVAPLPPSQLVARAVASEPGAHATRYVAPAAPDRSAEFGLTTADEQALSVYVAPADGRVLGSVGDESKAMWVIKKLHSLELLGTYPNRLMEMVGGWTLILTATGIYLWWPRRRSGGVVTVRGRPMYRIFWRDLHAVTGLFAGGLVFFLAFSGMPWSGVSGDWLNQTASAWGLGYPKAVWDEVPLSTVPTGATGEVGWTNEQAPLPRSTPPAAAAEPIGLDRAVAIVEARGISPGYELTLPSEPTGVYSAMIFPEDLSKQRVIHLDQYSGQPLIDVGVKDYGGIAQAIEWGISIHQGEAFGRFNQLLMLATCLAIVVMSVAAGVMWWRRRPAGRLGVPPLPADRYAPWVIGAMILPVAILLPLVGLSLLAALLLDWLLVQRVPVLRRIFS